MENYLVPYFHQTMYFVFKIIVSVDILSIYLCFQHYSDVTGVSESDKGKEINNA